MSRALRTACVLVAALAATPVSAQFKPERQTGSRIPVAPKRVEGERAAEISHGFARCIYQSNPRAAAALLENSDPVRVDLARAGVRKIGDTFRMGHCLGDEMGGEHFQLGMRMQPSVVRSMLAEQAYLAAHNTAPALPPGSTEKIARPYVSEGDALAQARNLGGFSDCVVFHDVGKADALLRTAPGTDAERAAARALAPALGACLFADQKIALNTRSIRTYVADGLWNRFARSAAQQNASR